MRTDIIEAMAESKKLEVRLNDREWLAVDWLARELGLTRSSLVRHALAALARAQATKPARDTTTTTPTT